MSSAFGTRKRRVNPRATGAVSCAQSREPRGLRIDPERRTGDGEAAALWRESLAERTAEAADSHLARYADLARQYGLRLPGIYERLSERFVRTLAIDRVRALVKPALEEGRAGRPGAARGTRAPPPRARDRS